MEIFYALRIEQAAARLIAGEHIDLVHSHFGWPAGLGGALAASARGIPVVTSIRGTDALVRRDLGYGLGLDAAYAVALRHLFRDAARILVATSFMQGAATKAGADPRKIQIIDKGVDLARFRPAVDRRAARVRLGISGPLLLAVGSLQRRKGFDLIIDAVAALGRPEVTLAICGSGEERVALQARAQERGVTPQIRFEVTFRAIGSAPTSPPPMCSSMPRNWRRQETSSWRRRPAARRLSSLTRADQPNTSRTGSPASSFLSATWACSPRGSKRFSRAPR